MLKQHKKAHHQIRLNREFRSDILWWTNFIAPWNGVSYLFAGPTSKFASDASGSWGCGAHTTESWFQMQWNEQLSPLSITIKELLPIMFTVVVWGKRWQAQKVLCHFGNQAVVAVLRSRSSKQPQLMHMLRCLYFVEALYGFELLASYIPTKANYLADDLSRNSLSSFLCKVPALKGNQVKVPDQLLEILIDTSGGTGHHKTGRIASGIFSQRARLIHAPILRQRTETF